MAFLDGAIFIVIGLISCFFGQHVYRLVLGLIGFFVGYYVATGLLAQQTPVVQLLGGVVAGLAVAIIFYSFYKFGYVLYGLLLGLVLGGTLANSLNLDGVLFLVVVVVMAIIGAILGGLLAGVMIRLSTAWTGASLIVGGVAAVAAAANISLPLADPTHAGAAPDSTAAIVTLVATAVVGLIGFIFQSQRVPENE